MIRIPLSDADWSSLETDDRFDYVCDWFEQALRLGQTPSAFQYAELLPLEKREDLLQELMLLEKRYKEMDLSRAQKDLSATISMRSSRADTDFEVQHRRVHLNNEETHSRFPIPFGEYILTADLGSGSFGDVFLAKHIESGVLRAIKVPRPQLVSDREDGKRFEREVRNASNLDHEGIVKFYAHGRYGNTPFLVSEFVSGKTLKEVLVEHGQLATRTAVQLLVDLAKSVHYAHEKKIIHRDLKPSNVMIAYPEGATEIDTGANRLVSKLLDFGISKRINSNSLGTLPGDILGTPAYMSPEQAGGQSHLVTPLSDVYSLGAILFELLVGRTPFVGDAPTVSHSIQHCEVPSLKSIDPGVDRNLATICEKALRLAPSHRYDSALELAADLERWLGNIPILAKPTGILERVYLWTKRNPRELKWGLTATVLCFGIALLGMRLALAPKPTLRSLIMDDGMVSQSILHEMKIEEWLSQLPQSLHEPSPLWDRLEKGANPKQLATIAEALNPHSEKGIPLLTQQLSVYEGSPSTYGAIASIIGVISPDSLKTTGASEGLVHWLIRSDFGGDKRGWMDFTRRFREPILGPLVDAYRKSITLKDRKQSLDFLHALLDQETIESGLAGLAHANLDELIDWRNEIAPYRGPLLPILRKQLETIGLSYPQDEHGEMIARGAGNLRLIAYGFADYDSIWPALAADEDPRSRSYFAHQIAKTGFPLEPLVNRLDVESNPSSIYGILVSLSQADLENVEPESAQKLQDWVRNAYVKHSDCGVHSMCRWFLKKWGLESVVRDVDSKLAKEGIVADREWYVNSIGVTMRIFRGPIQLAMPPPDAKAGRDFPTPATWEKDSIPYSYAIATEKISRAQYCLFNPEYEGDTLIDKKTIGSHDESRAAENTTWLQSNEFSAWLTKGEELSQDGGSSIRIIEDSQNEKSRNIAEINLMSPGYRLPTRHEWCVSFRDGAETESFFGTSLSPFGLAYQANIPHSNTLDRNTQGRFLPNRCGLFEQVSECPEWLCNVFSLRKNDPLGGKTKLSHTFTGHISTCLIGYSFSNELQVNKFMHPFFQPTRVPLKSSFRISQTLCE
jgi:serine/threonine protein kinase